MYRNPTALLVVCAIATPLAQGAIYMTDESGGSIGGSHYSIEWQSGNDYHVTIKSHHEAYPASSQFVIHGTGGEDITLLTIQVPSDGIGTNRVVVSVESDSGTSGIANLDEVIQTGTEGAVLALVNVKGYIGSITVDAIGVVDAVGHIYGPTIEATGDHWTATITSLECSGEGSAILANVTSAGRLGWITSDNGNVGLSSANRVNIQCAYSDGWIQGENVYADISATTNIARVKATVGEFVGNLSAQNIYISGTQGIVSAVTGMDATIDLSDDLLEYIRVTGGDFQATSSLACDSIDEDGLIDVSGDFDGDAVVRASIEPGNANADVAIGGSLDGSITIGDDLDEDITIEADAGLIGQIIINANDNSGAWSGDVVVGTTSPITLIGDEYTTTAASLGGGAVGLVPFSTHRESCSPPYGTEHAGTLGSITLRFYGPVVQDTVGADMPVKVYRGAFGSGANEVDVTDDYTVEMHPGDDQRSVKIKQGTAQFRPQFRYRLVPITSSPGTGETILLCDDLLTQGDVPVKGRDYWVDVKVTMGMLDMGDNGWVDTPDIALWMDAPEDFNGDSSADSQDLQLIVDNLGEPVD